MSAPTTTNEGHVYTTVPDSEAPPPAYIPTADLKYPVEKEPLNQDEQQREDDNDDEEEEQQRDNFELGLFGCFSHPQLCIPATLLSPFLFARTSTVMNRAEDQVPSEMASRWSSYINGHSIGYCASAFLSHGIANICWRTLRRSSIREKYNIKGNLCTDFLTSTFCDPCALAQEDYEVNRREEEILQKSFKRGQIALQDEYMAWF